MPVTDIPGAATTRSRNREITPIAAKSLKQTTAEGSAAST
jgi:hypothetical protein